MKKITLIGESGTEYDFGIYPLNSKFKEAECVYVYSKLEDGEWQPIYVGETEHLVQRLQEHATGEEKSDICIQNSGATHLLVRLLKPKSARTPVETDLRNNYGWVCNMQEKKG